MAVSLAEFSIYLLWVAAVIDPHGYVGGLRYFALVLVAALIFLHAFAGYRFVRADQRFWRPFVYFVAFLPLYGMVVGALRGGVGEGSFIDTSYISAGGLFFTSLIYLKARNFDRISMGVILILRLFGIFVISSFFFVRLEIFQGWLSFWSDREVALFSTRDYDGIEFPYIYFFASPMLLTLLSYDGLRLLERLTIARTLSILVPVGALILSGTRANIILAGGGFVIVCLWNFLESAGARRAVFLSGAAFLSFVVIQHDFIVAMFNPNEYSNSVKIGYLASYLSMLSDPVTFLWGQGFNAHVWSDEFAGMLTGTASKTELTYLEFLRVFGVPVSLGFLLILGVLIKGLGALPEKYQWLGPAVILNLLVSILNPYLFSTNGMLLLGVAAAAMATCSGGRFEGARPSEYRGVQPGRPYDAVRGIYEEGAGN